MPIGHLYHGKRKNKMKKIVVILTVFTLFLQAQKVDKLVLSAPGVQISYPLLRMIDTNVLSKVAKKVEFIRWHNPDQIRTIMMNQSVDFVALPSNVGAIFYNKGVNYKQTILKNKYIKVSFRNTIS